MKFQIREGAAASLGTAAVVARILYGITIDLPWLYNSGWISVLLGGVLALPVALAAAQLRAASAGKSPLSALNARHGPDRRGEGCGGRFWRGCSPACSC